MCRFRFQKTIVGGVVAGMVLLYVASSAEAQRPGSKELQGGVRGGFGPGLSQGPPKGIGGKPPVVVPPPKKTPPPKVVHPPKVVQPPKVVHPPKIVQPPKVVQLPKVSPKKATPPVPQKVGPSQQFVTRYDVLGYQILKAWQDREYNRAARSQQGFRDAQELIKRLQRERAELCRQYYRQSGQDLYKQLFQREQMSYGLTQLPRWQGSGSDFCARGCGWDYSSGKPKDTYLLRKFFDLGYPQARLPYRPY